GSAGGRTPRISRGAKWMSHPTDKELNQYRLNELSEPRLTEVEAHLDGCDVCLDQLEQVHRAEAAREVPPLRSGRSLGRGLRLSDNVAVPGANDLHAVEACARWGEDSTAGGVGEAARTFGPP